MNDCLANISLRHSSLQATASWRTATRHSSMHPPAPSASSPPTLPSCLTCPTRPAPEARGRGLGGEGDGLTIRRINYFFSINMSSFKKTIIIIMKKKYLSVFFANFFGSSPSCWHEKIWRWIGGGWRISLGRLKENTGVVLFIFILICANNTGFPQILLIKLHQSDIMRLFWSLM